MTGSFAAPEEKVPFDQLRQKIMVIRGMVMHGINKFLELGIRHRRPVDVEGFHMQTLAVKPARRVFPRILHIDAGIVPALDFDALHAEIGNPRPGCESCRTARTRTASSLESLPWSAADTSIRASSRSEDVSRAFGHKCEQHLFVRQAARFLRSRRHRAKPKAFDRKTQRVLSPGDVRSQLDAMPKS